jgi:hypothetical protein
MCSVIFCQRWCQSHECQCHHIKWQDSQSKWERNGVYPFFGPLCILEQCFGGKVVSESENIFWELFLDASAGTAVLKFGTQSSCISRHIMEQGE